MVVALNAAEYHFQGEGITASYFPHGAGGPLRAGQPETFFTYQDPSKKAVSLLAVVL
jgi:hypothetical protein